MDRLMFLLFFFLQKWIVAVAMCAAHILRTMQHTCRVHMCTNVYKICAACISFVCVHIVTAKICRLHVRKLHTFCALYSLLNVPVSYVGFTFLTKIIESERA